MKIKYVGSKEEINKIKEKLKNHDFSFVFENEDYILTKKEEIKVVIGKINDSFHILKHQDIIYVEALGNNTYVYTLEDKYEIKEKLYYMEDLFYKYGFIRVHKSYVVNMNHIKKINPSFNRKFDLLLSNNHKIEVSRTFYDNFKEYLGM